MLVRLTVQNLAVVEGADVAFGPGLNVITGETGAGKSVLMGALHLILGERADRSIIRTGTNEATVCAVYELSDPAAVNTCLRAAELPECEDGTLILRRSIHQNGSGRIRINDFPATATLLRQLAPLITDIHGPNDNLSLLDESFQLRLLTEYAGAGEALSAYQAQWKHLQALRKELDTLAGDPAARDEEIERLKDEIEVIEAAGLTEEDGEALTERHREAANAGKILTLGTALVDQLTDGEHPLTEQLMALHRTLRDLSKLLPEASDWSNDLSGAQVQLQELSRTIAVRLSQITADPDAFERLEARIALVQRLRRRYGPTLEDVFQRLADARARLNDLAGAEESILKLKHAIADAEVAVHRAGEVLRQQRLAAAPLLSKAITEELRMLGFAQASFPIVLEATEPSADGMDRVTFHFEPNPGERARPLADIASSGEIARVMLAVKVILAQHDAIPTLVFDEIDANIGGETSRCVGEKLRTLAEKVQLLCITHQPQAAVYGQHHFRVHKVVEGERTLTHISPLSQDERIHEIARMLGGLNFTSVTTTHAQEMLRAASQQ